MKSKRQVAEDAATRAWEWICKKYDVEAVMPSYYLSVSGRFPKFLLRKRRVRIAEKRLKWATYVRKRAGAYANWIPCTREESWTLQFVHEFTHAIQRDQQRLYSEVETTRNEIEFAREQYPHLYCQLTIIPDREG